MLVRTTNTNSASSLLSVGVLVDLYRRPSSGGHVKCWERIAAAAEGEKIDLSVYFLGRKHSVERLAENVRFLHYRPLLGTNFFGFLDRVPDHTDLAPFHPLVYRKLRRHQVLHSTGAYFSLARTAKLSSRWTGQALVHSVHTDTPSYTRMYSRQILHRILHGGTVADTVCDRWSWPDRLGARMQARMHRYLRSCDWTLTYDEPELKHLSSTLHPGRTSLLRRGIDREQFHPRNRDRERLARDYAIPHERHVLLCAGRIDQGKDVLTAARAARILIDRGLPIHTIFAGSGSAKEEIRALLGDRVSLPGNVSQPDLAWLYASSDLFVFPSQIEIFPNVVLEAKASGLPIFVSARGGSAKLVRHKSQDADGVAIESNDSFVWAEQIAAFLSDPLRSRAFSRNAHSFMQRSWPSWRDVLRDDLVPVWQRVARERELAASA
jgi:glycosyltransferase involved in cell wall biosynthesis